MGLPATSVDWIIKQSHRYPLLTAEEEITLARQVQNWLAIADLPKPSKRQKAIIAKGQRARERFFLSNIRLAVNVAGKYQKYSGTLSLEDLIQEGLLGLDSAIAKFDPSLGYKFSTYCYWWIRQGITRSINRYSRIIHLPMQANDVIKKAMDYMSEQLRLTGKLPPLAEVADLVKVQRETLIGYLNHHAHVLSLDQRMTSDEAHNDFIDVVADPRSVQSEPEDLGDYSEALQQAIAELSDTQQHIIRQRYFQDQQPTFTTISHDLNVSRQSTQQMHNRAMNCLRLRLGGLQGQACIQALRSA